MASKPTRRTVLSALVAAPASLILAPYGCGQKKQTDTTAADEAFRIQGGTHLVLEIDDDELRKGLLEDLRLAVRDRLVQSEPRISFSELSIREGAVVFRPAERRRVDARRALDGLAVSLSPLSQGVTELPWIAPPLPWTRPILEMSAISLSTRRATHVEENGGLISLTLPDQEIAGLKRFLTRRAWETLRWRFDTAGMENVTVRELGEGRVLVRVPGLTDWHRMKHLWGKPHYFEFLPIEHMPRADEAWQGSVASQFAWAASRKHMSFTRKESRTRYILNNRGRIANADVIEVVAALARDEPVVRLRLGVRAANRLARTTEHFGDRWFALLFTSEVASVVVTRASIQADVVQLSGGLTVEAAQNLAALLREGSLAPPMRIVEERELPPAPGS